MAGFSCFASAQQSRIKRRRDESDRQKMYPTAPYRQEKGRHPGSCMWGREQGSTLSHSCYLFISLPASPTGSIIQLHSITNCQSGIYATVFLDFPV